MRYLRQSTATTVTVGPLISIADGFTTVDGATVTDIDCGIVKQGVAGAAITLSASAGDNDMTVAANNPGHYTLELTTGNTDTLGRFRVTMNDVDVFLPIWEDFQVITAAEYDRMFSTGVTVADLSARIPAALVSGRIDASVGAMANDTVTAAAVANGAIDAATFAAGAIDAGAIADNAIDAAAIASNAITSTKIATGAITSATFAAGAITAAAVATDAIDADALATDAVTEIQSGIATAANVADAVCDELLSGHTGAGSLGKTISDINTGVAVSSIGANVITAASIANGAIDNATFAADVGSTVYATNIIALACDKAGQNGVNVTKLDAASLSTHASGMIPADVRDIAGAAVSTSTAQLGVNTVSLSANAITATAIATDAITAAKIAADAIGASELAADAVAEIADGVWDEALSGHSTAGTSGKGLTDAAAGATPAAVADAVWDEALSGHTGSGSAGEALGAAGTATNPWTVALPGAYTTGQAGKLLGDLGAPAGASISADIAAVKVDTAAILVDTGTTLDGRIPAALVSGRIDASVGAMAANVLTATAINADAITASKVADGTIDAATFAANAIDATAIAANAIAAAKIATGAITAAKFAAGAIDAAAIADSAIDLGSIAADLKTGNNINANVSAQSNIDFGALQKASLNAATPASVVGAVGSVTGAVGSVAGNIVGSVGSLSTQAKADVNAEIVDVLTVDAQAEPGQGNPAANASLSTKISYFFKWLRNKKTNDGTTVSYYNDDASTVDQKRTVADSGTTASQTEIVTGP